MPTMQLVAYKMQAPVQFLNDADATGANKGEVRCYPTEQAMALIKEKRAKAYKPNAAEGIDMVSVEVDENGAIVPPAPSAEPEPPIQEPPAGEPPASPTPEPQPAS